MKSICIFLLVAFFSNINYAQTSSTDVSNENDIAVASNIEPAAQGKTKTLQPDMKREDYRKTVQELNRQFVKYIKLPEVVNNYNSEVQAVAKVHINEKGKITTVEMEKSLGKSIDQSIMRALYKVSKVSPVLVDGVAHAQVVQLPVVIKP